MRKVALVSTFLLVSTAVQGVVISVAPHAAQAVLGGEFTISAKADQQQRILDATFHAATGQFLTVWSEHPDHDDSGGTEVHNGNDTIHGQLLNLDGSPAGGDFTVSSGGGSKDFPQVAHIGDTLTPANQLSLVVWGDNVDIVGQLIAPNGNSLQGGNFKISGTGDDFFPSLSYGQITSGNGVFLVVWERRTSATESEVWGELVQGAGGTPGALVGTFFQISTTTTGFASAPTVAYDNVNDRFLVAWGDDRGGAADEREIWAQQVDTAGNLVGANFQVSGQTGYEYAPIVLYHTEQQEFLVVWNRDPAFPSNSDVHARRISPAGALLGSRIDVAVTSNQEEAGDAAVDAATGRYVIPLTGGPTITDRNTVKIQKLSMTGAVVGTPEQVATDTTANKGPAVAVYGSTTIGPGAGVAAKSEVLVAWRDSRSGPDLLDQDIWGRMAEVQTDTDGDGLLDSWETSGFVDLNDNGVLDAGDLDFSTFPAADRPNVNHKDLYIEVDWMSVDSDGDGITNGDPDQPGDHDHAPFAVAGSTPTGTDLDTVIAAFAAAPVANPNGVNGITLHVDVGQLGGGGGIAETVGVDFFTGFETVKNANFAANRERVFRYGLFKHEGSGRGEIWGNDFWVGGSQNTQVLQSVTFMHEGGHTLGLRHGGADNINCKPNYFSIMSYTHSNTGIAPTFRFDYSNQTLPALDETNLNEANTLGDGTDQTMFQTSGGAVGPNAQTAGNVPIDWDNDGTPNESGAAVGNNNINNLALCAPVPANENPLNGFNDWANIRYDFRSSLNYDDNVHIFHTDTDSSEESKEFTEERFGDPSLTLSKTGTTAGIPGDPVAYTLQVSNAGPGPARNVEIVDTWPAGLTFTGATVAPVANVLNVDGSTTLTWRFDPLAAAANASVTANGTIDFPPYADEVTNTVDATGQNVLGVLQPAMTGSLVTDIQFPEIEASKAATGSVNAGEKITYRITYENTGDAAAHGVVITDTLPADVYYNKALDTGAGPKPNTVTANPNGTTTLTWSIGTVAVGSGPKVVEYTARPSLLFLGGSTVANGASVDFTDANGNDYPAVPVSASTTITVVAPSKDPMSQGFWRNHPGLWTAEILARVQATDDRYDGIDGSAPNGVLSPAEVTFMFLPGGNMDKILKQQLLATYLNLASRRINAGTVISSTTANRLGLGTVRAAAIYAMDTLLLPVNKFTKTRYSDIEKVIEEINLNKSEVY